MPSGRRFDAVAPVELERVPGPVPLLGDAGELENGIRRAGLGGAAPRVFGPGPLRRIFFVEPSELFARRGPGGIHADRAQKRGLGGGEIAAPPVDRGGELGRLRERRIEPLRFGEKIQRGAEGLEVAGFGKDLRLAPAVDGLGRRLVRPGLGGAGTFRRASHTRLNERATWRDSASRNEATWARSEGEAFAMYRSSRSRARGASPSSAYLSAARRRSPGSPGRRVAARSESARASSFAFRSGSAQRRLASEVSVSTRSGSAASASRAALIAAAGCPARVSTAESARSASA